MPWRWHRKNTNNIYINLRRSRDCLCVSVAAGVGVWVCGFVGLWVCGFVGLWVCGFVGLWVCGFVSLRCFIFGEVLRVHINASSL